MVKPTTLLHANCPIIDVLAEQARPMDPSLLETLIGHDGSGKFRTAKAKEYPPHLCKSFAIAFFRHMCSLQHVDRCEQNDPMAEQLALLSSRVDPARSMQPDYQPMR